MTTDTFGTNMMYADLAGGQKWEADWTASRSFGFAVDPNDSWSTGRGTCTYTVSGGVMSFNGDTPRLYIANPNGTSQWGDVEVTVYFKRVQNASGRNEPAYAGMEAVARTNHVASSGCDSRGVDARMRVDGYLDFEKETSHPSSSAVARKQYWSSGTIPFGVWIGYKYVCYDLPNGDVKLELYIDETDGANGGTWKLINTFVDNGSNMGGSTACKVGVSSYAKLNKGTSRVGSESGKPNISVYFRSDNVGNGGLLYKKASVREIDPTADTNPPVPPVTPPVPPAAVKVADDFNVALSTGVATKVADDFNVSTVPVVTPTAPLSLVVVPGDKQMAASWLPPTSPGSSDITGYRVVVVGPGFPAATINLLQTEHSTTFSGLTNGVTYSVNVSAKNGQGYGDVASAQVTPVHTDVPPGPVTDLVASVVSATSVQLQWSPPAGANVPTSYLIDPTPANGEPTEIPRATSYVVIGLTPDTDYTFTVTGKVGDSPGTPVTSAVVHTFVAPDVPPESVPPLVLPLPQFEAFPQPTRIEDVRVFRPVNFGLTIDEVPKGE